MKKRTIWLIALIMALSFISLLILQVMYIEEMVKMKKEQFDESVNRSLYQASRNLELNETLRFLEKDIVASQKNKNNGDSTYYSNFQLKTMINKPSQMPKAMIMRSDKNSLTAVSKSMQEMIKNRYIYQKAILEEVVYSILYTASDKPLKERINFKLLDQDLRSELLNNGIDIPYHFKVLTRDGREIYRCSDYESSGEEYTYSQILFRNDPQSKMAVIKVHFPEMSSYVFSSVRFLLPSVLFSLVLLITFITTIAVIFRQKRYSEMRNDFINNMTHELKTPISSISLASQMLNDESVTKSPTMMKHLGGVISDETKRLRFLVEKVLQMSMFDRKKTTFNKKELDLNDVITDVAKSFNLRVEHTGGKIDVDLQAVDSDVYVDEVHFTNMIFNLFDNAVKYRKPDEELNVSVATWNEDDKVCFSVSDNGIGIRKDDLKKIFEKFYRVHTGNVHNVKGFGLGLAYVKRVVDMHSGQIHVDSEYGDGTKFTIKIPFVKESES